MTSSLVGSEMCIRDSFQYVDTCKTQFKVEAGALPHTPVSEILFADAVSYTHLTLPTICSV
eukprot:8880527-Prorocentrum_lima.AAC.1